MALRGWTQRALSQTLGRVRAPPVVLLCSQRALREPPPRPPQVVQDLFCVVVAGVVCHLDQPVSGSDSGGTGGVLGAQGSSPVSGRVWEQL